MHRAGKVAGFATHGGSDIRRINQRRARGQGMTEYIIIVALIAVAAIGRLDSVRSATSFGGQTSLAAAALSGDHLGRGSRPCRLRTRTAPMPRRVAERTLSDFEE
jgi:Flp pilus assembly pilin Flp